MLNNLLITMLLACGAIAFAANAHAQSAPWQRGVWADKDFFPICVWLQNPSNAAKYKAAGINTYIGLWKGPTEKQLADLKAAGLYAICDQNDLGLKNKNNPTIIAWMHGDEPDNAQAKPGGGYGPPITPEKIIEDYKQLKQRDPSRPVVLNLSQGVAWDNWIGRGVRSRHPEDYPEYVKGCDIASFDIYPVAHRNEEVQGNLWYVPYGVERLIKWTDGKKPVWTCIECTHINQPNAKASPHQIRAEVWMAVIEGARGIIWFVHEFKPGFKEAAILDDPANLAEMTRLNKQITKLAPVINSPAIENAVTTESTHKQCRIATSVHRHAGDTYIFAAAMRDFATTATFHLKSTPGTTVEVIDENRTLQITDGQFTDDFKGYDIHLYRIKR